MCPSVCLSATLTLNLPLLATTQQSLVRGKDSVCNASMDLLSKLIRHFFLFSHTVLNFKVRILSAPAMVGALQGNSRRQWIEMIDFESDTSKDNKIYLDRRFIGCCFGIWGWHDHEILMGCVKYVIHKQSSHYIAEMTHGSVVTVVLCNVLRHRCTKNGLEKNKKNLNNEDKIKKRVKTLNKKTLALICSTSCLMRCLLL